MLPMPDLSLIITVLLLWLLIAMLLAPLEALGWWAGWFEGDEERDPEPEPDDKPQEKETVTGYLVYLTGISGVSGEVFLEEEIDLLNHLDEALPHTVVVDDVYPYGVANQALTGQRVFAWFWRFALNMKLSGQGLRSFIGFLINMRNAFQVAVSADRRYGPIYNSGSARMIVQALLRHGYRRGSGMPVTLLGYSGGGQIAVGSVPYLKAMINAPIRVVSLGGVISADPGVMDVEHLYHLQGKYDKVHRFGYIVSPSRWHIGDWLLLPESRWNMARKVGKISFVDMGDMTHNGKGGYLDTEISVIADGRSNMEVTVGTICNYVADRLHVTQEISSIQ